MPLFPGASSRSAKTSQSQPRCARRSKAWTDLDIHLFVLALASSAAMDFTKGRLTSFVPAAIRPETDSRGALGLLKMPVREVLHP